MDHLPSYNPRDNDFRFPEFQFPRIVGEYSVNGQRECEQNRNQLQLMKKRSEYQNKKLELDIGFDTRIKRKKQDEKIDGLLKWILHNRNQFNEAEKECFNADFICFRGVLRLIMNTPYEMSSSFADPWIIRVMKWKGSIFLCKEDTEEEKNKVRTERDERFCYWGYKFEDYMTRTLHQDQSVSSEDINENEEFCCLFRTKLGGLRLLYGAEMDGYLDHEVTESTKLSPNNFVELKTSRFIQHPKQEHSLRRFKMLKWWTQCFIVGIPKVLVGWRDDHGLVHEVEEIPVESLPRSAKEWKGNVCVNYLLNILKFLNRNIQMDSLTQVYRLTWYPDRTRQGLGPAVYRLETESGTESFLPDWFHSQFKS